MWSAYILYVHIQSCLSVLPCLPGLPPSCPSHLLYVRPRNPHTSWNCGAVWPRYFAGEHVRAGRDFASGRLLCPSFHISGLASAFTVFTAYSLSFRRLVPDWKITTWTCPGSIIPAAHHSLKAGEDPKFAVIRTGGFQLAHFPVLASHL